MDDWGVVNLCFANSCNDTEAGKLLCTVCMGDGADQKTRSKAGQILWVSDIQVQDASDDFKRSIKKFALYLTKY